ncbi:uncharacterized protein LOC128922427 [Zeugodacus cucurbitae]|uniref:uncharacterized protein LOC128922427 n=1 Tax=Zeugodacus cucurbitae TaxID=28588 RepID=UPI0023D9032B|nr:uncharacterized protein LOC128922427 [Zeugodacus cucurbitae]
MAKFSELRIPQLKRELEQRGLATNGLKSELQARLREAMEEENISVDEFVFESLLEESTTKIEEKEDNPCSSGVQDMKMVLSALSQISLQLTEMKAEHSQLSTQISAQISVQLKERKSEANGISSQLEKHEQILLTQTEANDACMSKPLEAQGQVLSTHSEANGVSLQVKEEEDESMDVASNRAEVSTQLEVHGENMSTQLEANQTYMLRPLEAHEEILLTQLEVNGMSSQLIEEESMELTLQREEVSTQLEVHGECIPSQVSAQVLTQLKEQEVHKSMQVIPEKTDVSWTKDCDMKEQESQDEAPVVKHPKNEEMYAEPLF